MNDRNPHTERDHVLVDVKAQPSGWPSASPDLDSGRSRSATSGITGLEANPQISGLYGFRGLPAYRRNYDRLVHVKGRYDPTNLFHINHNIPPS
jgi:hypothetical protein